MPLEDLVAAMTPAPSQRQRPSLVDMVSQIIAMKKQQQEFGLRQQEFGLSQQQENRQLHAQQFQETAMTPFQEATLGLGKYKAGMGSEDDKIYLDLLPKFMEVYQDDIAKAIAAVNTAMAHLPSKSARTAPTEEARITSRLGSSGTISPEEMAKLKRAGYGKSIPMRQGKGKSSYRGAFEREGGLGERIAKSFGNPPYGAGRR